MASGVCFHLHLQTSGTKLNDYHMMLYFATWSILKMYEYKQTYNGNI